MKYVLCHTTHHVFFFFSTSIFQTEIHYTHCCALFYYRVEAHRKPWEFKRRKNWPWFSTRVSFALSQCFLLLDCYFVVMSSVQVQHDVLFLFTNSLLFRQALHYSSTCFLDIDLSSFSVAVFLSVRFLSLPKTVSNSRERCMINQKAQTSFFEKSKYLPPMWVFFPSVGDMQAAAKKLFCQPSDEPQQTFVKDYERSFSVFHNWNVTSFWPVRERQTSSLRAKQEEFVDSWPELT